MQSWAQTGVRGTAAGTRSVGRTERLPGAFPRPLPPPGPVLRCHLRKRDFCEAGTGCWGGDQLVAAFLTRARPR